jgi:hypothetical protein
MKTSQFNTAEGRMVPVTLVPEDKVIARERAAFVRGVHWANDPRQIGFKPEAEAKLVYPLVREQLNVVQDPTYEYEWSFQKRELHVRYFVPGSTVPGNWFSGQESTVKHLWVPTPERVRVWAQVIEKPVMRVAE